MINIHDFLQGHQTDLQIIITGLLEEFSSHDFIEKFAQQFEDDYIEMLVNYQKTGTAFQTVHSMIAKHLSQNMPALNIEKIPRKGSENVFGSIDVIQ